MPEPIDALTDDERHDFEKLQADMRPWSGTDVVLMRVYIEAKPRAVICTVRKEGDNFIILPVAMLLDKVRDHIDMPPQRPY